MRRTVVATMMLVAVLVAAAAAVRLARPGAGRNAVPRNAVPGTPIDLQRTRAYLAEWASRGRGDAFPESPGFALYNAYATVAAGGRVSPELAERIARYVVACERPDGGYGASPSAGEAHVVHTHFALQTLELLGRRDRVDPDRTSAFLRSLAQPDGGLRGRRTDAEASLGTTFHAAASLALLSRLGDLDRGRTLAYVERHREPGRGYGLLPGMPSTPAGTFMAMRMRALLGQVPPATAREVVKYLAESRYAGRLREGQFTMLPHVEELAYVLETLRDLGGLDVVDRPQVERFLGERYVAVNGGFGPEPGLGTTPPSTYHALRSLVMLGRLPEPRPPQPPPPQPPA